MRTSHASSAMTALLVVLGAGASALGSGPLVQAGEPFAMRVSEPQAPGSSPAGDQTPASNAEPAPTSAGAPGDEPPAERASKIAYGLAGAQAFTLGFGAADDFASDVDTNFHAAYSVFLADEIEFAVEAALWHFNQPGDNTGGISGSMVFRWHLLHPDDYAWTVFADAGIGLLAAFDETPAGGSEFNFLPRVGGGATFRIDDSDTRLMVGVRWHHISNARITGDAGNPARDSLMGYAAIVFPF